jgi:hypothetical protein
VTRLLIVALTAVLALPGATWLLTRCAAANDTAEPQGYVVLPSVYDRPGYAAGAASATSAASLASTPIDTTAGRAAPTMAPSSSTASAADPAATTTATTGARR